MDTAVKINFSVTPSQEVIMQQRARENGFESLEAYLKVVAVKAPVCKVMPEQPTTEKETLCIDFEVSAEQKAQMQEKLKGSDTNDLSAYLKYVALNALVNIVVEVRSTGNLDAMLQRIASSRAR
ncbi:MAG: hypothetical protein COB42_07970 [Sulfurimonas sp.]|nr:MAG: hypothetical protein COB42_07970 [Sulfurimonas sp.]